MNSFGECPSEVIKAAVNDQCPNGYPMSIRDPEEWTMIARAWNQGIDAYLEALTERSSADHKTGKINIHPDELHVFLRRLWEDGSDEACSLRTSILGTLDIEEV